MVIVCALGYISVSTISRFRSCIRSMMSFSKCLVINADDLGYNRERDKGIFECFSANRCVTSASVLANSVFGQESLETALKIGLPVGLHFNISEGKPFSKPSEIQSLLQDGVFRDKSDLKEAAEQGLINKEEVELELESQISWFKMVAGTLPVHIDGHQHVHIMPTVRDAFCNVLKKHNVKWTRMPNEKHVAAKDLEPYREFLEYVIRASEESIDTFSKAGIQYAKAFVGLSTMGSNMSKNKLLQLIQRAFDTSHKTCELMVHPGYSCTGDGGCGIGPDDFSKSKDREHEMAILRDPNFKEILSATNIELKSFAELEL